MTLRASERLTWVTGCRFPPALDAGTAPLTRAFTRSANPCGFGVAHGPAVPGCCPLPVAEVACKRSCLDWPLFALSLMFYSAPWAASEGPGVWVKSMKVIGNDSQLQRSCDPTCYQLTCDHSSDSWLIWIGFLLFLLASVNWCRWSHNRAMIKFLSWFLTTRFRKSCLYRTLNHTSIPLPHPVCYGSAVSYFSPVALGNWGSLLHLGLN